MAVRMPPKLGCLSKYFKTHRLSASLTSALSPALVHFVDSFRKRKPAPTIRKKKYFTVGAGNLKCATLSWPIHHWQQGCPPWH
ncbi:hypothetical protein FKM82_000508 [Ascaphus truei]